MEHLTYAYDGNEIKQFFDKQARDREIVKRDASLIQCFHTAKHAKSYAESKGVSVDLVISVWSSRIRA